jgi:hypothetical protein
VRPVKTSVSQKELKGKTQDALHWGILHTNRVNQHALQLII